MSVDLSGELTAIATAVLAFFAIITAVYAVRAFRKQSQEVHDQAAMLSIQSDQLAEQRKINAEQTRVLALQASELTQSLSQRNGKPSGAGARRPRRSSYPSTRNRFRTSAPAKVISYGNVNPSTWLRRP
jgi:hypothetical protein